MSNLADTVISSLPSPIPGNGIFNVNLVVPDGSFSASPSNPSTSYSYPLMDPAKLIGTVTAPFMNVGISSYITTLYNNVFNINNNLQNDIQAAAIDDRHYPTSFAVQTYVQSQIAGTQLLNNGSGNTYIVSTTVNNTLVQQVPNGSLGFQYVDANNQIQSISLLYMDTAPDEPRIGTTKTVMFADTTYLSTGSGPNQLIKGDLIFLYAGDNSVFAHMGGYHKYYQFVYAGDFVTFVQAYNGTNWIWLVTSCMGVFSDTINVTGANINVATNSVVPLPGSTILPLPVSSSMGGVPFN